MEYNSAIRETLKAIEPELISFRRLLHQEPELSFKEFETTKKIAKFLDNEGIKYERFKDITGLSVDLCSDNGKDEPLVLLRADIDALPIQDTKSTDYRSKNDGVMHACGHDVHSSIMLGVLVALNRAKSTLKFNIRMIFQPAEELGSGAKTLVGLGILQKVDYAIALHVDPSLALGKIAIRPGSINAAVVELEVSFHGETAHVARIHQGIDTLGPACMFVNQCYAHVAKKLDARDPHILYFGVVQGGVASNIVCDEVRLVGTIRAFRSESASLIANEVQKIGQSIADYSEVTFEMKENVNLKAVVNDPFVSEKIEEAAIAVLSVENTIKDNPTSMGGEDFGEIMSIVPGAMLRLGVAPETGKAHGLHTSDFDVNEKAILIGAEIMANSVLNFANK